MKQKPIEWDKFWMFCAIVVLSWLVAWVDLKANRALKSLESHERAINHLWDAVKSVPGYNWGWVTNTAGSFGHEWKSK